MNQQHALSFLHSQAPHLEHSANTAQCSAGAYKALVPYDILPSDAIVGHMYADPDMLFRITHEQIAEALAAEGKLNPDDAIEARCAAEHRVDTLVLEGDPQREWEGLTNSSTVIESHSEAMGSTTSWEEKDPGEILTEVNGLLHEGAQGQGPGLLDTLLLPKATFLRLCSQSFLGDKSVMRQIKEHSGYASHTGHPLKVHPVPALETAAPGQQRRAVAYRNDPSVLKLHLTAHKFLEPFGIGSMPFEVQGAFYTGGLQIRRPSAVRYLDGI